MQEYVCNDGRMSVNGICAIDQKDGSETYDTTKTIIDSSKNDKVLDSIAEDGTSDYFPDLGKEKKSFSWEIDKPSKVEGFTKTINENIDAYNNFVETNLGIPTNVQNGMRIGASGYGALTGGSLISVLGPFALPVLFGGGIKKKENDRIERITNQDNQGNDNNSIDMMTYDIPTYGNQGYNIHNDAKDKADNNNSGHNAPGAGKGEGGGYASDFGFI